MIFAESVRVCALREAQCGYVMSVPFAGHAFVGVSCSTCSSCESWQLRCAVRHDLVATVASFWLASVLIYLFSRIAVCCACVSL